MSKMIDIDKYILCLDWIKPSNQRISVMKYIVFLKAFRKKERLDFDGIWSIGIVTDEEIKNSVFPSNLKKVKKENAFKNLTDIIEETIRSKELYKTGHEIGECDFEGNKLSNESIKKMNESLLKTSDRHVDNIYYFQFDRLEFLNQKTQEYDDIKI